MKRHIKQFCLPVLAALAAACSDFDLQDQFDAEFHKVVGVSENVFQSDDVQTFYNLGIDGNVRFHISRGGSDPSLTATVSLTSMTAEEIAEYTSFYTALPTEYFTLPESVTFAPGEERKAVDVNLTGDQIAALKSALDEREPDALPYALAVKLSSEDGTTVKSDKAYFIRPVIVNDTPDLTIGPEDHTYKATDEETILFFKRGETELTVDMALAAALPVDVKATVEIDAALLEAFNAAHGIHTEAVVEMERTELEYPAGTTSVGVKLTADDSRFDRKEDVVVPLLVKLDYLNIERKVFVVFGNAVPLNKEMIRFGDDKPADYSMGTFPDNLIDGDKETSITTGGGNGQWWYNYDNDYYGHSIIIDLGETAISELCLRYQTRTSLETLPGGTSDDYPTVTQNGKARPHEVGLGVGSDGSNWTFLGKTIVSEEMTAPDDWTSGIYALDEAARYVRFGIVRTWEPDPNNTQQLVYFANGGWWSELSELYIYDGKRKFFE
jgi:hypothetical protein